MPVSIEPKVRALKAIVDHLTSRVPSGDGHDGWRELHSQIARFSDGAEALYNLSLRRNPVETEAAHIKRVAAAAAKFGKEVEAALDRANTIVHKSTSDIESRIKAKVRLHPDAYGNEIREAWRGMSQQERTKALNELVEENRGPELAAILRAPRLLSGLSEDHRHKYETAFVSKWAPEELVAQDSLMEAFNALLTSRDTAREIAKAYAEPGTLAEIARAEAAATAAAKTFDNAIGAA